MNTELSMCRSGAVDPRPISSWTSTALSFRTTTDATKFVQISNPRSNADQNLLVCQQRITGQILRAATQKLMNLKCKSVKILKTPEKKHTKMDDELIELVQWKKAEQRHASKLEMDEKKKKEAGGKGS